MYRVFSFWTAIGLISLAAGCSMCAHPYDDCGPTAQSGNGAPCCPTARAGSILAGDVAQVASPIEMIDGAVPETNASVDAAAPSPAPAPMPAAPTPPSLKQWNPSVPRSAQPY